MFDIDKILGKKKNKKFKFDNMNMSNTFGKNPFSDMVGKITGPPLKKMGASPKMQNQWKQFSNMQKKILRQKFPDTDGDRVPNKWDCQPLNTMRQDMRFSRRPNKMPKDVWSKMKKQYETITAKSETKLDPRVKMNTILSLDKELKSLNKVNSFFKDDKWHEKYNKEAKTALKMQGYNDDDVVEFLSEKNKVNQEFAAFMAQELGKSKIGEMFKGAIPEVPISEKEGMKRFGKMQDFSKSINIGIVSDIAPVKKTKPLADWTPSSSEDEKSFMQFEAEQEAMEEFDADHDRAEQEMYEQLKSKPFSKMTPDEQEFFDAMVTGDMNMTGNEMGNYYGMTPAEKDDYMKHGFDKRYLYGKPIDTNPKTDTQRWQTYEDIYEKEASGQELSQDEKDFVKYHDLKEEKYSELTKTDKEFMEEYRFKKDLDTDYFEGETDEYDNDAEFYRWRDNRQ